MKIGILTLPILKNYGGILQAYALQTTLMKMGHEPYMIMRRPNERAWYVYNLLRMRSFLRYIKGGKEDDIILETREKIKGEALVVHTKRFIDSYINPKTEYYYTTEELEDKIIQYKFDAYVVGSDQIWRPKYSSNIYDFYLDFEKNKGKRRIAYAASFGTSKWEYNEEQTQHCKELLNKFDAISVREMDASDMTKKHFGVDAVHVLDPTMLLSKYEYVNKLKLTINPNFSNSIFAYILDNNIDTDNILNAVSSEMKIKLSKISFINENKSFFSKRSPFLPVEQWIEGFYNSPFIVTDSFHGCVFSIIFNKPFIAYGNKERGLSRFTSLLGLFGLENRLCTNAKDVYTILAEPIDWERVNKIINTHRDQSILFLKTSIEDSI